MKCSFIVDDNVHLIYKIMQVLEIESTDSINIINGLLVLNKDSITPDFIVAKIKQMGLEDLYNSMTQPSNKDSHMYCIKYIDKELSNKLAANRQIKEYIHIEAEGKYTGLGSITTVIHKVVDKHKLIKDIPDNVDEQDLIFVKTEIDYIDKVVKVLAKYRNETPRRIDLLAYETVKSLLGGITTISTQFMTIPMQALKIYYIVV